MPKKTSKNRGLFSHIQPYSFMVVVALYLIIGASLLFHFKTNMDEYGFLQEEQHFAPSEKIGLELYAIQRDLGFDGVASLYQRATYNGDLTAALEARNLIDQIQSRLAGIADHLRDDQLILLVQLNQGLKSYDQYFADFIAILNAGGDYQGFHEQNSPNRKSISEPLSDLSRLVLLQYQQEQEKKMSFLRRVEVYVYLAFMGGGIIVVLAFLFWRQHTHHIQMQHKSRAHLDNRVSEYKTLITNTSDAIIYIDQQGVMKYVNPAATYMFGYHADEMLGKNVNILLPVTERMDHDAYLKNSHLHKSRVINSNRGALQGLHKNGSIFMIDLNVSLIEIDGKTHYAGIIRDISEREKIQQELTTLYEDAPVAYATIQLSDGRITRLNKTFEQLLGYSEQELLGSNILDYQSENEGHIETAQVWADFFHGAKLDDQEVCFTKSSGESIWLSVSAVAVIDDAAGIREGRVTMTNISDRKEATEKLQNAIHQAYSANDAKTRFLSNMSHELRTPLNSILGHAQLLLNSKRHKLVERQQRQVSTILSSGNHLLSLIDEVLDMARVESGKDVLTEEEVNLYDLLRTVWEETYTLPTQFEKQVHFDADFGEKDFFVYADPRRLRQVFLNLLSNAVKYNKDGGWVQLNCEFPEIDLCRISVSDTGMGIAPDKLDDVFSPFKRLGAELTQVEGTGIGLYLTKMLVENMGGGIGLHSTEGEGSRFWVEFPLVAAGEEIQPDQPESVGRGLDLIEGDNKVLLYIEDNAQNVSFMESFIEELDNTALISALDGESGLSMAKMIKPDAILLDISLPDIDGITVMQKIRTMPEIRDIPVAAVTSNIDPTTQEVMMDLGCKAYIRKPVDLALILDFLEKSFDGDKKS